MMALTIGEKIRVVLGRRNMTIGELAEKTGQTRQNMSNKMTRDNFSEKDILAIADALDCTFDAHFVMNDTNESI